MSQNSEMKKQFQDAIRYVYLNFGKKMTIEDVPAVIDGARNVYVYGNLGAPPLTEEVVQEVKEEVINTLSVEFGLGTVIVDEEYRNWLPAALEKNDWKYWARYRKYLVENGRGPNIVDGLSEESEGVLRLCGNPEQEGNWDRRGLVMGNVQSGKTANYIALMTKAVDMGYRVVIVVAGVHNNLRSQTQKRIDEGFLGFDSTKMSSSRSERLVGVGHIDQSLNAFSLTDRVNDFSKDKAGLSTPFHEQTNPVIFVIKKNVHVLKSLHRWLKINGIPHNSSSIQQPLLLIDDEADNASVNTRYNKDEITTINKWLRKILNLFSRSSYVGYTATPFANIFIDPDTDDDMVKGDLFPRSFIYSLDTPSNYFGPEKIFIEQSEKYIREITDAEPIIPLKHKKDIVINTLPHSLLGAIRFYLLATAVRRLRGLDLKHSSMLVNVSRFVDVQKRLGTLVSRYVDELSSSLLANGSLGEVALEDKNINDIHSTWLEEFHDNEFDWDQVLKELIAVSRSIEVKVINGKSKDALDFSSENGNRVIAVGGLALSRGLTLEGLVVSYYLRNSMNYDTLIQMGRWFGYREGYEDLCRIYMPETAQGHFRHVAEAIEELRQELSEMARVNGTPKDFGLKIRRHPDTLQVTARNKMGASAAVDWYISYASRYIESTALYCDKEINAKNMSFAKELAANLLSEYELDPVQSEKGNALFNNVDYKSIYNFLTEFQSPEDIAATTYLADPIREYIEERLTNELREWDVVFTGTNDRQPRKTVKLGSLVIKCQQRTPIETDSASVFGHSKQRIANPDVEKFGLPEREIGKIRKEYLKNNKDRKTVPGSEYRRYRTRPLLVVQIIDYATEKNQIESCDFTEPIVALGISFPGTQLRKKSVKYQINKVEQERLGRIFDYSEFDDDEDLEEGLQ